MVEREVKKVVTGAKAKDGAGVSLTRVLNESTTKDFDPFLMLDSFDSENFRDYIKGFPWHPHRGIETVTYVISGDVEHRDSLGNEGSIKNGSCQWMTAGGGIIHQEMLKPVEHLLGAQLWINLPKKYKMVDPAYRDISPNEIPVVKEDGVVVRVVSGSYKKIKNINQGDYVKTTYLDVELKSNKEWEVNTTKGDTVFIFIVEGSVVVNNELYERKSAVLFTDGDVLKLKSGAKGSRFLYLSAKPLNESIVWGGPIVMNTKEELNEAFKELADGTFVRNFNLEM